MSDFEKKLAELYAGVSALERRMVRKTATWETQLKANEAETRFNMREWQLHREVTRAVDVIRMALQGQALAGIDADARVVRVQRLDGKVLAVREAGIAAHVPDLFGAVVREIEASVLSVGLQVQLCRGPRDPLVSLGFASLPMHIVLEGERDGRPTMQELFAWHDEGFMRQEQWGFRQALEREQGRKFRESNPGFQGLDRWRDAVERRGPVPPLTTEDIRKTMEYLRQMQHPWGKHWVKE